MQIPKPSTVAARFKAVLYKAIHDIRLMIFKNFFLSRDLALLALFRIRLKIFKNLALFCSKLTALEFTCSIKKNLGSVKTSKNGGFY